MHISHITFLDFRLRNFPQECRFAMNLKYSLQYLSHQKDTNQGNVVQNHYPNKKH